MRFLDRMKVRVFVIGMLKKNTYRRCVDGEKNAFGTDGCFWHLKGGCVLNSCPIGLIRFSSISSFDVAAYMKHGIACKIETRLAENNWKMQNASPTHIFCAGRQLSKWSYYLFAADFTDLNEEKEIQCANNFSRNAPNDEQNETMSVAVCE